jgi:hypothetical protein
MGAVDRNHHVAGKDMCVGGRVQIWAVHKPDDVLPHDVLPPKRLMGRFGFVPSTKDGRAVLHVKRCLLAGKQRCTRNP